jgi:hypothetical protein
LATTREDYSNYVHAAGEGAGNREMRGRVSWLVKKVREVEWLKGLKKFNRLKKVNLAPARLLPD